VEPETVALASTAATTLVTLLATDAWGQVKEKVGALWGRFRPDEAEAVEAELTAAREEVTTADEVALRVLRLHWESRLLRLAAADADAHAELKELVAQLQTSRKHLVQPAGERFGPQHRDSGSGRRQVG
jgi:hypothetical protein